jgi:hypothetical protein
MLVALALTLAALTLLDYPYLLAMVCLTFVFCTEGDRKERKMATNITNINKQDRLYVSLISQFKEMSMV